MINKGDCTPNTIIFVNNKVTKWNTEMGTINNGLYAFPFDPMGVLPGIDIEIAPDTHLEILSKPKRFNANGNQVLFRLVEDVDDKVYSTFWVSFKHKVNKF